MPFSPGLDTLEGYTDTLEALIASTNSLLTTIQNNSDQLEGYTDQIEGLITTSNSLLTTIRDNADQLEGYTDGIEGLLTTIRDNADQLEGYVDQLEGYVDGLEGLIATTNATLSTIQGNVDQLEGYVDGLEGFLTDFSAKFETHPVVNTTNEKTFIATTNLINVGTTETAFFLLKNPNASGKNLRLLRITPGIAGGTMRLYHTPTITSDGTGLTEVNNRIKTSPTAAVATAFSSPTISANGTLMYVTALSAQINTRDIDMMWLPLIEPNFNILVTFQAGANNTPTACSMVWMEV